MKIRYLFASIFILSNCVQNEILTFENPEHCPTAADMTKGVLLTNQDGVVGEYSWLSENADETVLTQISPDFSNDKTSSHAYRGLVLKAFGSSVFYSGRHFDIPLEEQIPTIKPGVEFTVNFIDEADFVGDGAKSRETYKILDQGIYEISDCRYEIYSGTIELEKENSDWVEYTKFEYSPELAITFASVRYNPEAGEVYEGGNRYIEIEKMP